MESVIVLFEVTIKDGKQDDYLKMAASLKDELSKASGFVRSEKFSSLSTDGKLLSMFVWENEDSITEWRNQITHRMCQQNGRESIFADYSITVVSPVRTYSMDIREQAPLDSNSYWKEHK